MSVRTPPIMPRWRGRGICQFCGEGIVKSDGSLNTRLTWHPDCVGIWFVATQSQSQRNAALRKCNGICQGCGADCKTPRRWRARETAYWYDSADRGYYKYTSIEWVSAPWHADHIVPLWSVDKTRYDAFKFWTVENLQMLCDPCHAGKTRREAGERAALKRESRQPSLLREAA